MRLLAVLFSFLPAVILAQSTQPDRLLSALKGRALADHASRLGTDERVSFYETLIRYKPDDLHYKNLLATAFIQKMRETTDYGYLDRAAAILESVLSSDANDYEALRLREEIELERHQFAQAAEDSQRMAKIAPEDPWNWGALGDALMELGQYEKAAGAYQKMVSIRPDLSSYNRAAYYRFIAGDAAGAIDVMKRAIAAGAPSGENTAWCLVDLGNLYFKTGRLEEAAQAYAAALRVFPGYHPAFGALGRVQAAQGKNKDAIKSYKRAQAAAPFVDYTSALQDLYEEAGLKEEAARQVALIEVVDKLGVAAREKTNRNMALIYADHDRKIARALELAESEFAIRKDVYTSDVLAWALYKNRRYSEAANAMAGALKMGTPEPGFYYHAGMIAYALGNKEEARKQLGRALSLNPKFDFRQAVIAEETLKETLKEVRQ
ncbi:MAG: tetratricopeptide repeat protein [Acidobacteriota bacterium]|nr:tetratricopeptide repeat protein [Acidobacteriota bacterium]